MDLPFAFLGGVGTSEMVLVGIVALMLFGSRLPEVARKMGGTYRGLKRSVDDFKKEFEAIDHYEPPRPKPFQKEDSELDESSTDAPKFTPPS
jgi:sec-independent protein translocase protein TatA